MTAAADAFINDERRQRLPGGAFLASDIKVRVSAPTIEWMPDGVIAATWEASTANQGEFEQNGCLQWTPTHLRFSISVDGGLTWTIDTAVMYGACPVHTPVLFWDAGKATTSKDFHIDAGAAAPAVPRLLLFYTEARKSLEHPGGDIKCIATTDRGTTWSAPTTLLSHESEGCCAKCLGPGCRLVQTRGGAWLLPFARLPNVGAGSRHVPFGAASSQLRYDTPGAVSAGVLVSRDRGRTWRSCGRIVPSAATLTVSRVHDPLSPFSIMGAHFLRDGTLAELAPRPGSPLESRLVMLLRYGDSTIVRSMSKNGGETWSDAAPLNLPPLANGGALRTMDSLSIAHLPHPASGAACGGTLLAVYSSDARPLDERAKGGDGGYLHVATSSDGGESWHAVGGEPIRLPLEGQLDMAQPVARITPSSAAGGGWLLSVAYCGVGDVKKGATQWEGWVPGTQDRAVRLALRELNVDSGSAAVAVQ